MSLDLIPLFEKIMVKEKEVEDVTAGGIIIPESAANAREEHRATEGVVLAVGSTVTDVKVGDRIYYGRYSGTEIKRNGESFWCMNEGDVIALIKEESHA